MSTSEGQTGTGRPDLTSERTREVDAVCMDLALASARRFAPLIPPSAAVFVWLLHPPSVPLTLVWIALAAVSTVATSLGARRIQGQVVTAAQPLSLRPRVAVVVVLSSAPATLLPWLLAGPHIDGGTQTALVLIAAMTATGFAVGTAPFPFSFWWSVPPIVASTLIRVATAGGPHRALVVAFGGMYLGHLVFGSHHLHRSARGTVEREIDLTHAHQALAAVSQANEALARTDELTGLPNRRVFEAALHRAQAQARRSGRSSAVVLFDIDHFKAVNDDFGHPSGDAVLRSFAAILAAAARPNDTAARIGGEEWGVVLEDTDADGGRVFAARVLDAVRHATFPIPRRLTASAGVAALSPPIEAAEAWQQADQALYAAKHAGRDRVTAWERAC